MRQTDALDRWGAQVPDLEIRMVIPYDLDSPFR